MIYARLPEQDGPHGIGELVKDYSINIAGKLKRNAWKVGVSILAGILTLTSGGAYAQSTHNIESIPRGKEIVLAEQVKSYEGRTVELETKIDNLNSALASTKPKICIYDGDGVWKEGVDALQDAFRKKGLSSLITNAGTLNRPDINNLCDLVTIPGGWSVDYYSDINLKNIVGYVKNGGSYLGICAGTYFVSRTVVWNGESWTKSSDESFPVEAIGPIESIASWPNSAIAEVTILDNGKKNTQRILYWGGPYFKTDEEQLVEKISSYKVNGESAIIGFPFGAGYVILTGVHPEIIVNYTDFVKLSDVERDFAFDDFSDIKLFWNLVDRLLQQEALSKK
jgi:glutamine amidotransferase-like uncharacterized protein